MKFRQFICNIILETIGIPTEEPILIVLTGGIASGKSSIFKLYFSELPVLDIDLLTKGNISKIKSMSIVLQKQVEQKINNKESVVYTKTGACPEKIIKNIQLAKNKGMKTAVVFVDTPIEQALQNNIDRASKKDWHLIPEVDVRLTNINARKNYKIYKEITDYNHIIKY